MSEQEIYLDECKLIYLENWGYSFYYADVDGEIKGVKFPKISLTTEGGNFMGGGHPKINFEANSGSLFLLLELSSNDNVCGGYSSREYINMINQYSQGRHYNIVIKGKINNSSFEFPVNQIEDGKIRLYASNCNLNLQSDSCPFSITDLMLYDNDGLRPSNDNRYSFDCTFEVRSGSIGTCPPSIPNFDCGILNTTFYSGEYIKWEGFTTSVSNSTSTCKARINGENISLGQQKTVYNSTGTYRYLVID